MDARLPHGRVDAGADDAAQPDGGGGVCAREGLRLISGTDEELSVNAPVDWPAAAGPWNAKAARFNAARARLAFETHRADIVGGSHADSAITAPGVTEYYRAGPQTGTLNMTGTAVIMLAEADGRDPRCLGCVDMRDGVDGVEIYRVAPATAATPNRVERVAGGVVYANQHKELAAWLPDGSFLIAGIEMPHHALGHDNAGAEKGLFNDLWAISADGRTWVQLTDYATSGFRGSKTALHVCRICRPRGDEHGTT